LELHDYDLPNIELTIAAYEWGSAISLLCVCVCARARVCVCGSPSSWNNLEVYDSVQHPSCTPI